jgi:hypothetical protein
MPGKALPDPDQTSAQATMNDGSAPTPATQAMLAPSRKRTLGQHVRSTDTCQQRTPHRRPHELVSLDLNGSAVAICGTRKYHKVSTWIVALPTH